MLAKFVELEGATAPASPLRSWVNQQRIANKQGKIQPDRRQRLEAAAFIWAPGQGMGGGSRKGVKMPKRAGSKEPSKDLSLIGSKKQEDVANVDTTANDSTDVAAGATPAAGQPAAAYSELEGEVRQPAVRQA